MRLKALTFDGYQSGQTDFGTLLAATPQADLNGLIFAIDTIARQITDPVPNLFLSLIVVGHSDRQDRGDLSCDERRASEASAAEARATSAWEWIKQEVAAAAARTGLDAGTWWEDSTHVTWGLVFAGAGMLRHNPPSEEERPLNRRVVILLSIFSPE